MKSFFKNLYITNRVYFNLGCIIVLFALSFFYPMMSMVPRVAMLVFIFFFLLDILIVFNIKKPFQIVRDIPERLSNGDENLIKLVLSSNYNFPVYTEIIEELPFQFQKRNFNIKKLFRNNEPQIINYTLQPSERGEYDFGNTILFVSSIIGLVQRKVVGNNPVIVPTYPSFKKMQRFSLMAISNRLTEIGVKQIRKMGHSSEFEQIKDYVKGDDIRTINWKASARKSGLMVNNYTDERSQQVYCIINKGRVMKMPFDGLSLLDHAINASLVLTNVALGKKDKAGLITFSNKMGTFLPADSKSTQMNFVLENLYKQETTFLESDFEKLYGLIRGRITHRSLLVLFTNFETYSALERELPFLKKMAAHHLLMVVFFENTEVKKMLDTDAINIEQVYAKTIAEKFSFEKRKIVKELNHNGILTLLTTPADLTVNAINRYLELKMRRAI
jgi:uncharacterized protein (DUF58 family)